MAIEIKYEYKRCILCHGKAYCRQSFDRPGLTVSRCEECHILHYSDNTVIEYQFGVVPDFALLLSAPQFVKKQNMKAFW